MQLDLTEIDRQEIQDFWIIPNRFINRNQIDNESTLEERKDYEKLIKRRDRLKRIRKLFKYGIIENISYFKHRRKIVKWIRTVKKFF
jgi:hypothetical protein